MRTIEEEVGLGKNTSNRIQGGLYGNGKMPPLTNFIKQVDGMNVKRSNFLKSLWTCAIQRGGYAFEDGKRVYRPKGSYIQVFVNPAIWWVFEENMNKTVEEMEEEGITAGQTVEKIGYTSLGIPASKIQVSSLLS